jgi:hypothetical protein
LDGVGQLPGEFNQIHGIATDTKGNIYLAEARGRRALKFHARRAVKSVRTLGAPAAGLGGDCAPFGLEIEVEICPLNNRQVRGF